VFTVNKAVFISVAVAAFKAGGALSPLLMRLQSQNTILLSYICLMVASLTINLAYIVISRKIVNKN